MLVLDRTRVALQPADGGVGIERHDQSVAGGPGALEKLDVSGVKQVEAPVVKPTLRPWDFQSDTISSAHSLSTILGSLAAAEGRRQLARPHGRRSGFADCNSSGGVADAGRRLVRGADRKRQRQRRDHRVACSGNVENLERIRRGVNDLSVWIAGMIDGHPLCATGEHHRLDLRTLVEQPRGDFRMIVVAHSTPVTSVASEALG